MNRAGRSTAVASSVVAAATTWIAMLSWQGFAEDSNAFLGPLLVLAAVVAGVGILLRLLRSPGLVVVLAQVITSTSVGIWLIVSNAPIPGASPWTRLTTAFEAANDSATRYSSPVSADAPGIDPLLIAAGLGCLLLVDLLACTLRRASLSGLPLLTVCSIPVSLIGTGLTWWVFVLTAAGFLTLLYLQQTSQISLWGRSVEDGLPGSEDWSLRTGASRASAGAIGAVATTLAIVVPLAVPTLDLRVFDFGAGGSGGDSISLRNPMTDLRRDLARGADLPLVRVTTDQPSPSYLRVSVLNRFSANEWSSGDRDIPSDQLAQGEMPELTGVSDAVPRTSYDYSVEITDDFESTWLPTQAPISRIDAPGDWRYDATTMDFIAGSEDDLTTAGIQYDMTAVDLGLEATALMEAPSGSGAVRSEFLALPDDLPPIVGELNAQIADPTVSPFEQAVALQNWFRVGGGFTYSLETELRSGVDDLVAFLSEGEGGRTGYCEQFASAMAVMARDLGIPARVAVGFLSPDRIAPQTWEYSAHDMHAWPELYFPGAGWVPFEPTPPTRANGVPSYTRIPARPAPTAPTPSATAQPSDDAPDRSQSAAPSAAPSADATEGSGAEGSGIAWLRLLGIAVVVLLVLALLALPRLVRGRRRSVRTYGDPEQVWAELRDTAIDLGVPWPAGQSPRVTGDALVGSLGAAVSRTTPDRPEHGRGVSVSAEGALDRIVLGVERHRYAKNAESESGALADDCRVCVDALIGGASRRARRRAQWWPRSAFRRAPGPEVPSNEDQTTNEPDLVR